MNKFVYILHGFSTARGETIQDNEVGILKKQTAQIAFVQFVNYDYEIAVPIQNVCQFDPLKTGDQFDKKVCNRCNRLLPTTQFDKNQNGKNNRTVRRPSCVDCREFIDGKSVPSRLKTIWERTKPDMEIWECPICKKRTIPGLTSKVVLDHDHTTGEPRAWICDSCNTGLGRFKDDIDVMYSAINYLKKK